MINDVYIYDTETLAHDNLAVFKDFNTKKYHIFANDGYGVRNFIKPDAVYIGFNSKSYDQFIIKSMASEHTPEETKQVNDWIIAGNNGWQCPWLEGCYFRFNDVDLMNDMQEGQSLKSIEGHLGMDITESSIPFDIDRKLNTDEMNELIQYCKADVDATERVYELRKDYFDNKIKLGITKGLEPEQAMAYSNARLTAIYLDASPKVHHDERQYKVPKNLLQEYIPTEVFEFFNRMYDESITDDELFSSKLELMIGKSEGVIGYGGIHSAIMCYKEVATNERMIINLDVGSYYPHLCTINHYTSRNIPNPEIYEKLLEERMTAKKNGDKATANALKLVANTTYGATLSKYNDLYDPLMARSVCISGQLYLLELARHLLADITDLEVIQTNTDGIMISFPVAEYEKVMDIAKEWQSRTGFELEEDKVFKIVQRDVNNYLEVGDELKIKGGTLVRGIAKAGAFKVNNNANIVAKAVTEFLANDIPIEKTINGAADIFDFQIIAKASHKYGDVVHKHQGIEEVVQRCNRVYATNDYSYGTLYKTNRATLTLEKIAGLPMNCIVDNDNHLGIESVDREWYIRLAERQANDFLGIKPPKKNTRAVNKIKNNLISLFE